MNTTYLVVVYKPDKGETSYILSSPKTIKRFVEKNKYDWDDVAIYKNPEELNTYAFLNGEVI